jgi:hypothetical protein
LRCSASGARIWSLRAAPPLKVQLFGRGLHLFLQAPDMGGDVLHRVNGLFFCGQGHGDVVGPLHRGQDVLDAALDGLQGDAVLIIFGALL